MFNKKAANPKSELQTPGEIKRREVELGSHKWVDCLVGELFSKTPGEILFSKTPGEILFSKTPGEILFSKTPGEILFSKTPGEILFSKTPGEMKSREVELDSLAGWMVLLLNCSPTVAFRTLSLWLCFRSC